MDPGIVLLSSSASIAAAGVAGFAAEVAGSDLGPWVQGGSATIAVAALAYIAKLFAQGKLVARDSAEAEKKLADGHAVLIEIVKASQLREDRLFNLVSKDRGS